MCTVKVTENVSFDYVKSYVSRGVKCLRFHPSGWSMWKNAWREKISQKEHPRISNRSKIVCGGLDLPRALDQLE